MAKHNVYVNLPNRELGKVDAIFTILQDGSVLGQINISKGGIDYYPKNSKKPIKIGWSKFDKLAQNKDNKLNKK
jgi:hypothetical protein